MIIDGNKIAEEMLRELRKQFVPQQEFAAVVVGDDPASLSFLRQKEKTAQSLGIRFKLYQFEAKIAQSLLIEKIAAISGDPNVGGMIVQLPLPAKFDRVAVLNAIGIQKDVDVLNGETTKILAPAAGALARVLDTIKYNVADKHVVVVGSGLLVGRPIVNWLITRARQVTVLNRGGYDPHIIRTADLVVAGTGVPRLIRGEHLKLGAAVIDFGYGRDESDQLAGDVDAKSVQKVAGYITPTPGGMGPIVVAQLFANFYRLTS